jgi:methanogenic corrinoid protein MtbC1
MVKTQMIGRMIRVQQESLAEAIVAQQYSRQPELWESLGETGREKCLQDVSYHLSYLSEALTASDPSLFVEYVAWAKSLFANLGFSDETLAVTLTAMRSVLKERLPGDLHDVAHQYVEAALRRLPRAPEAPKSFISDRGPLSELARAYLDVLLDGQRHAASRMIIEAANDGVPVRQIYLHVFQPVQREIGRLWQTNQISVAQEHYCTAATQLVMSQLYPRIFSTERIGRRMVATCVSEELHEIGLRMIGDFFEMEGWDTYYLGANTPTRSIISTIEEEDADVLAISVTITMHVSRAADLIDRVRSSEAGGDVKILVGGYPFNLASDLWRKVGADGYARNAQEAIATVDELVASSEDRRQASSGHRTS